MMSFKETETTKTTLVLLAVLSLATVIVVSAGLRFRNPIRTRLNRSKLAIIQNAIGEYLSTSPPIDGSLHSFLLQKRPQIDVTTNEIFDVYKTAVKYVIDKRDDGIFVGVYSAGKDKRWGTKDDMKREGTLLLNANKEKIDGK